MKNILLIVIVIVTVGCVENNWRPDDLDFLSGTYEGVFLLQIDSGQIDTTKMYFVLEKTSYLVYYINVSDCPFEGKYYLTTQFHFEVPIDTCQHNAQASLMFRPGDYSINVPGDSLLLSKVASDTLRQYKLKRLY